MAEACDEAGVALVLIPFSEHGGGADDVVRSAVVDGFVAHCDALDPARRTIVRDRRLPLVVLDGRSVDGEPSVGIDEEQAAPPPPPTCCAGATATGRGGALHAARRGGRQPGRATPLAGYRRALEAAGRDPAALTVVDGAASDRPSTTDVVARLLARPDRPSGVRGDER